MEQKPSVGRIVHYQPKATLYGLETETEKFYALQPRAAIITSIRQEGAREGNPPGDGSMVDLAIIDPEALEGFTRQRGVWFADTPTPGHWNWPPRV